MALAMIYFAFEVIVEDAKMHGHHIVKNALKSLLY